MKLRHPSAVRRVILKNIVLGLAAATALDVCSAFAQSSADDTTQQLGQRAFLLCQACHSTDEGASNKIGPNLSGVFGRKAGTRTDFAFYSDALKKSGITWSDKTINQWITNPREMVPGTKMAFAGIDDEDRRKALIAFLKQKTGAAK